MCILCHKTRKDRKLNKKIVKSMVTDFRQLYLVAQLKLHKISLETRCAFFLLIYFLLQNICFTEFCHFLSNLNTNQPEVYIYLLPFEPPSHHPPHPIPLGWYKAPVWVSWASKFPLAIYSTYGNVGIHVTLSIPLTLSSPLPSP